MLQICWMYQKKNGEDNTTRMLTLGTSKGRATGDFKIVYVFISISVYIVNFLNGHIVFIFKSVFLTIYFLLYKCFPDCKSNTHI